ncbi:septum formation family protein [Nocardioides sp. Root140]|uniref:septum formation family protein n=1 Tax=Nocardioides sp. Root140 TaxID=1736460 RepID=UPI0006F72D11|nr:septum formation family protein [Nocardioides sp. Root140]KQY62483.1 hypothetical protein ASD30_24275 [Nocardioides sp. Root140]
MLRSLRLVATTTLLVMATLVSPSAGLAAPVAPAPATVSPTPATVADDTMYGAPTVGQCYNAGVKATSGRSLSQTVSCRSQHTLWVLRTVALPDSIPLDYSRRSINYQYKVCMPAVKAALGDRGAKFGLSTYELFRFLPTAAQESRGARWVSCSVGSWQSPRKWRVSTAGKPVKLVPAIRKYYQRCLTYRGYAINCGLSHVYRATFSWVSAYPYTSRTATREAERVCPRRVRPGVWRWSVRAVNPMIITCYSKQQ